ncbi:MAG: class I SAM-dependent methyltransferase [Calditrichaeota bacterium]|nr:class I SAM-dependent methyltransferase [Calditrichota bacterium]
MKNRDTWQPSKFVYRNGRLIASRDDRQVRVGSRLMADMVARFYDENLEKYAAGKLLDLGCGKVPLFQAYRELVKENICVDWANTLHKNEYIDFECDLTQALPFPDEEFDTIILSDVLEHIPNPENLWREMARILAKGGHVFVNTPFYYFIHEEPHDYYRYTEFALRRFVQLAGLKLIYLRPMGGIPEILADLLAKTMQIVPGVGRFLAGALETSIEFLGRTFIGKRISTKTGQHFPFGYALIAEKIS